MSSHNGLSADLTDPADSSPRERSWLPRVVLILSLVVILVTLVWPHGEVESSVAVARLDHLGRAVCGQLTEHSFECGGRQLPLCARCTGTYLGALVTYLVLGFMGRGRSNQLPPLNLLLVLGMLIALWALDGFNSYATLVRDMPLLYEPSNLLRLASGLLQGLALMVVVRPIVASTVWAETEDERVVRGYGDLLLLLVPVAVVGFIVQVEAAWLYYPLALSSVAGEVLILTLVNTLVACLVLRRVAVMRSWRGAAWLWALGMAAALIEINLISAAQEALENVLGLPL